MKINRDVITDVTIRQVEPGTLRIGDETFTRAIALTSDKIIRDWPQSRIEDMQAADLDRLIAEAPEMIVIGTGWRQVLPPKQLVFPMARLGIGIEVMDTPAAARTFNILVAEGRRPAALLLFDHPAGAPTN